MAANKIKLTICGANYVVMSEESEEYIQELAARLDEDMNNLMSNMPSASVTAAAIVTALGYLDELKKAENGADNMRSQVHEYLEDASKARMEALDASRRLAALQKEHFGEAAEPLYPRIVKYFQILESYHFISFKNMEK